MDVHVGTRSPEGEHPGQEDQRPQAAHRRRHDRPAADRADHGRRRARPRRGQAAAAEPAEGIPCIKLAWAGGGYAGKLVTWARMALKLTIQIVRRPGDLHTFQVLPRRWVAGRTLAWITRCRRTVRDYERLTGHHETIVYWSMIITMSRRLARSPGQATDYDPGLLPGGPAWRVACLA
jgi:transposase